MPNEIAVRIGVFLAVLGALMALERWAPRRHLVQPRARRWSTNLALVVIDSLAVRAVAFALPILAAVAAADASAQGIGLFNRLAWPAWLELVLAMLAFDLAIWAQHLITHKVPLFWRFHRVHHADRDFDVTTALRFHPVEIVASAALKVGLVYLLGRCRAGWNGGCGWCWSRQTCTGCIIRSTVPSMTAITALPCRFGTGFSAPMWQNRRQGMRR